MFSVTELAPKEVIKGLLGLTNAKSVLDVTYGNACFWDESDSVVGSDINPDRAKSFVADFNELPLKDGSFDAVVYDPPFHPNVGSREQVRFASMGNDEYELKAGFLIGAFECWRVTSDVLIVKCQGFIHNHSPQWMPLWVCEVLGEPFEWAVAWRKQKVISGRWKSELSLRRNHADYLMFRKKGNKR